MMLDMKRAFDQVVRRNTADAESAERILSNRFYKFFSSGLAGTQEYSAVEQLHEIAREERYDLIVLDTPPTQHALDFLDAPDRLYNSAIDGVLDDLDDPYSSFLAASDFEDLRIRGIEGDYGGVGLEVVDRNGMVTVVSPMPGTMITGNFSCPDWTAGIK